MYVTDPKGKAEFFARLYQEAKPLPEALELNPSQDRFYGFDFKDLIPTDVLKYERGWYSTIPDWEFSWPANEETRFALEAGKRSIPLRILPEGGLIVSSTIGFNPKNVEYKIGQGIYFTEQLHKEKGANSSVLLDDLDFFKKNGMLYFLYGDINSEGKKTLVRVENTPAFEEG